MQHRPWDVDEEDAQPEKMSRKKRRAAEAAARGADVASGEAYTSSGDGGEPQGLGTGIRKSC